MADKGAEEAPKKKKGKLPIILVLLLVLGGGGFFMMKGNKKNPEAENMIKIGKETHELGEFLTNLADDRTYVRAELSIKGTEKFTKVEFEENKAAIEMAVTGTLRSLTPSDLAEDRTLRKLRRRLAAAINRALEPQEEKDEKEVEGGQTKAIKKEDPKDEKPAEIPDDWDSATGPVLQVFPRKLATQ